jgi:hypothetical protein
MVEVSVSVAIEVCDFVYGDDYCGTDLVSVRLVICLHGLCFLLRCLQVFRRNLYVGRCGQKNS